MRDRSKMREPGPRPRRRAEVAVQVWVTPEVSAMLRGIVSRSELNTSVILRALIQLHRHDTILVKQQLDVTIVPGKEEDR